MGHAAPAPDLFDDGDPVHQAQVQEGLTSGWTDRACIDVGTGARRQVLSNPGSPWWWQSGWKPPGLFDNQDFGIVIHGC